LICCDVFNTTHRLPLKSKKSPFVSSPASTDTHLEEGILNNVSLTCTVAGLKLACPAPHRACNPPHRAANLEKDRMAMMHVYSLNKMTSKKEKGKKNEGVFAGSSRFYWVFILTYIID
jgi:hypothetical protein